MASSAPQRRAEGPVARLARAAAPDLAEEVGFELPWRERLSTRLLGFVAAAVLLVTAALFAAELAVERQLLAQATAESELLSDTVRLALHRAMLQDRRADAYQIMEDVARQRGIDRLRLIDGAGRVAFSTAPGEAGVTVPRQDGACAPCHAGGEPLRQRARAGRSRVHEGRGGRVVGVVTPLHNETACATAACHAHAGSRTVLGLLDVGLSTARLDAATAAFRWRALGASALAALLLGLAFWAFARRHVVRPVGALVAATHRVAREDLDGEVPETFDGELGLLAGAFNSMVRSLRAARADLQALLGRLEQRVAERSDALASTHADLVRSEKLASLGKLSASIAHEINNPISGIMTFARLIARTLEQGPPDEATRRTLLRNLRLVEREGERCSDVVRNLLDFAHERTLEVADVPPNAVVEDALQLVHAQLQLQGVRVERRLGALPHVPGDFGLLRQACVNVVMNACEAMPFEGTLTVETAVVEDGREVELAFRDTGPGIPEARLARVFDPFFSTQEGGAGLGLSVVHGLVRRHGGRVLLESEEGKGTRVALRLPVAGPGAPAADPGGGPG
jgi:two-component system NtrC family sensor kinase